MNYPTYKDLCINVLLRMGEDKNIVNGEIQTTTSITAYLKTIPALLNDALNILATAGKYIVRATDITQYGTETGVQRYDLSVLCQDFYSLTGRECYFTDSEGNYEPASNYRVEAGKYIVVSGDTEGTWTVYYNAYPQYITQSITDDTVLYLDPEIYAILPLYIEGKLRLISDEDYASMILNEFEGKRDELMALSRRDNISAQVIVSDEVLL